MTICILGFGSLSINANADEGDEGLLEKSPIPIELSAETAIYSQYVWRGFVLDSDPVIQPSVTVGAYGFSFNFWSSFDIDSADAVDGDEVDFTLDYTYEHDLFTLFAGHTWYTFPPSDTDTQEFYIGGGVNIPIGEEITLSPTMTWIHDYGDTGDGGAKGDYIMLGLEHSIPIPIMEVPITLDLSGEVAYNHEFFIAGDGGYALFGTGLTIPLYGENVTFAPNANISIPFGDLEDNSDGAQDVEFYYGGVLAFSY